jgi:hypothetical protein
MKKVTFVGNCQAEALFGAYSTWIAPESDDIVQYVPAYEEANDAATAKIQDADIIVLQVTDSDQMVNVSKIRTSGRVITFPMVTAFFLWPFHSGAHPRDREIPDGYKKVFTGNFGDKWLDRRLLRGEDPDSIVGQYRDLDVVRETNLERLTELVSLKQQERDTQADMKLGQYFMDRLPSERVFLHMHHPNLSLFAHMVREVFSRADCSTQQIEQVLSHYRGTPFPSAEVPIHPRIAEHFRLSWATPELKYRFEFGERVSWDEYCSRYVNHDWNEPLQTWLKMAHTNRPRAELELLAAGLETAAARYDSAEGFFALAETRRRLGDIAGSLDAIERAYQSDPLSVTYTARRSELLFLYGRRDEGLAAAMDLAVWQPRFKQGRLNLLEMYMQLGRPEDALGEARAAFALDPLHPLAVQRLAQLTGSAIQAS